MSMWDALQDRLSQTAETVTRPSRIDIVGGDVDEIDPPEDIDQYAEWAKNTAIIRANLRKYVNDVWEPGYRLEGPDETVQYFEGELEELDGSPPEETPDGGFLSQCFIFAGEKHQDFYTGAKESTWQRWARGTVLIEYLKQDDEDPESDITGFHFIRPETVYPQVHNNTNILIAPDETDVDGVELTKRGEAAAYIQFDDESILGLRNNGFDEQDIPLSQNDVLKQTLEPDIGGDIAKGEGVFGTSALEAINNDIAEYKQTKRDRANAIQRKAYGLWTAQFKPEVIEGENFTEVIEWTDDQIQDTERDLNGMEPKDVLTSDANIDLERHDAEVPDLDSTLLHYVDNIMSALPAPKYKTGFEDDINRDVTSEQGEDYEDTISEERQYQEQVWTEAFRFVAERAGLPTEGLEVRIAPPKEDNPVKSLDADEIERMNSYISTLAEAAGPQAGPTALVSREAILEVVDFPSDMVDESAPEEIAAEVSDGETEAAWADVLGVEALQAFSEGDEVDTPAGVGVVVEIRTEAFTGPSDEEVEASEDNPAYVVAVEEGARVYRETDLESGTIEVEGVDTPEEALHATGDSEADVEALQDDGRTFDYPESWKKSDTPARIILLKAWAGMGGTFTGARQELGSARLAASMKDRVLNWEGWRQ